jgi:hypothetical protein
MKPTTIFFTIIVVIIVIIIIFIAAYYVKTVSNDNQNLSEFFNKKCKKQKCYDNFKPCTALHGYIYTESNTSSDIDKKIERRTLKCVLEPEDKNKLMGLTDIFIPSIFNGSFCDVLFTTYYDYQDLTYLKNRMYNLNLPLAKCIRVRRYLFNPNIYFELKYRGGTKLRALIDENYDLLEFENIDEENKDIIVDLLNKIKNKKIKPLFNNIYKRLSFIYKNNPSIRMTIDSDIEFIHNNIYKLMNNDILELKIPNNISLSVSKQYIEEINELAGVHLKFGEFSKFEYYYNIVTDQK